MRSIPACIHDRSRGIRIDRPVPYGECGTTSVLCCLGAGCLSSPNPPALPGIVTEFPQDYFNHPDFQTEMVVLHRQRQVGGRRHFGIELTFSGKAWPRPKTTAPGKYATVLCSLALSDLDGGKFLHAKPQPGRPGIAGVSEATGEFGTVTGRFCGAANQQVLQPLTSALASFHAAICKPPVIHERTGRSSRRATRCLSYISAEAAEYPGRKRGLGGRKVPVYRHGLDGP